MAVNDLGLVLREMGEYDRAQELLEEGHALFLELGDRWGIGFSLANLGIVAWNRGEYDRAAALFSESLALRKVLGDRRGISTALTGLGVVSAARGQPEHSAVLYAAAEALRAALGIPPPPFIREEYDRQVAAVRAALDPAAFDAAWQRGAAMSMEDAIAFAAGLTRQT
jgi:tetratricopeptide (TPR) repeat protein